LPGYVNRKTSATSRPSPTSTYNCLSTASSANRGSAWRTPPRILNMDTIPRPRKEMPYLPPVAWTLRTASSKRIGGVEGTLHHACLTLQLPGHCSQEIFVRREGTKASVEPHHADHAWDTLPWLQYRWRSATPSTRCHKIAELDGLHTVWQKYWSAVLHSTS
jgi:hypothetical protein